jgi:hypothetical protein
MGSPENHPEGYMAGDKMRSYSSVETARMGLLCRTSKATFTRYASGLYSTVKG